MQNKFQRVATVTTARERVQLPSIDHSIILGDQM